MEQGVRIVLNWFRNNNKREGDIISSQQLINVLPRISEQDRINYNETIKELIESGYLNENSKYQLALTDKGERELYY